MLCDMPAEGGGSQGRADRPQFARRQGVKMDVGCIFRNQPGNQGRGHVGREAVACPITYDIPNESRLEPTEWGTAAVE